MTIQPTFFRSLPLFAIGLFSAGALGAGEPMFDPVIDRPGEAWCYAAQSTTVIGRPFVPEPVQITYDGAIYT
ncbi:MAG: hypothetical protein HQ582_06820, partial [Planctomycetes bacterium]|nr:hypothetical protein [Planctomycetota bacterium]